MICVLVFIKISNKGSFINHYVRISRTIWPPLHIIRTFFNMPEIEKALDTTHLTLHSSHSSCRAQCISLLFDFARYNEWDSKSRDSRPLVTSAVDYIHNTESIRIRTNLWCRFFSVNRPKGTSSLKWTRTHLSTAVDVQTANCSVKCRDCCEACQIPIGSNRTFRTRSGGSRNVLVGNPNGG